MVGSIFTPFGMSSEGRTAVKFSGVIEKFEEVLISM